MRNLIRDRIGHAPGSPAWRAERVAADSLAEEARPRVLSALDDKWRTAEVREDLFGWLNKKGYGYIPSEANMVMVNGKRPGRELVAEVLKHKVAIGRSWPAMPNHVRVTIGTKEEMASFKEAFEKVMGSRRGGSGRMAA